MLTNMVDDTNEDFRTGVGAEVTITIIYLLSYCASYYDEFIFLIFFFNITNLLFLIILSGSHNFFFCWSRIYPSRKF